MGNIAFGTSISDDATPTADQTMLASNPVGNVQDLRSDTYAETSSSVASCLFTFNSLAGNAVDFIAVVGHNLPSGASDQIDTTITGTNSWSHTNERILPARFATGESTTDYNDVAYDPYAPMQNWFTHSDTGATSVTAITVNLDPASSQAVRVHQIMYGTSFVPSINFDLNMVLRENTNTTIQRTESGRALIVPGKRWRELELELGWLTSSEQDEFVTHMRYAHARPLFIMPLNTSETQPTNEELDHAFMGVFAPGAVYALQRNRVNWRRSPIRIIEI